MTAIIICSDFGATQNKVNHCFPIFCHEVMGLDAMILVLIIMKKKKKKWPNSSTNLELIQVEV